MNQMIEAIKELNPTYVCMIKAGSFYHAYGRDAYILSYFFNYKLKSGENNIKECGFPVNSANKIMAKLEKNKVNYLFIDKRTNFEVDNKMDFKKDNKYEGIYAKAKVRVNYIARIENINASLLENIEKENFRKVLSSIEDILYEI